MARTLPCPACRKKVSAKAPTCLKCGHPLATDKKVQKRAKGHGSPATLAVVMLGTLGVLIGMAVPRGEKSASARQPARPAVAATVTDAQIVAAIKGSDDLDKHNAAFIAASRQFLKRGGMLADLREMGGWVRSQTHKPRRVYVTYKQPGNVANRWYYDVDRGQLFQ